MTAVLCGLPIALFGALTFIVLGWKPPSLPVGATGFVMWSAFLGIVLASVPFAWPMFFRPARCGSPLPRCC